MASSDGALALCTPTMAQTVTNMNAETETARKGVDQATQTPPLLPLVALIHALSVQGVTGSVTGALRTWSSGVGPMLFIKKLKKKTTEQGLEVAP